MVGNTEKAALETMRRPSAHDQLRDQLEGASDRFEMMNLGVNDVVAANCHDVMHCDPCDSVHFVIDRDRDTCIAREEHDAVEHVIDDAIAFGAVSQADGVTRDSLLKRANELCEGRR